MIGHLVRRKRSAFLAVIVAVAVAACSSSSDQRPIIVDRAPPSGALEDTVEPRDEATRRPLRLDRRRFVDPLHMRGDEPVRVALLLPFSNRSKQIQSIASAMFDAAQLAAFEAGNDRFLLIPKDTKGTAEGADAAAKAALADGAEIILGPLFAPSVKAVADVATAYDTPVIAFSSDMQSGRDGVYLLSFPPEQEISRITDYAVRNGLMRFGLLAPANKYGERVAGAFASEINQHGGILVHQERYEQDVDAMRAPAKRLAEYSKDIIPVELRHGYDPSNVGVNGAAAEGYDRGYQAVLMPEQGTLLRALAPLLPYYNVNINQVKLLGVSGWNNPRLVREPALRGGWFAAPDPEITEGFATRYSAAFGQRPPQLASLSYDATLLAARLAQNPRKRDRFSKAAITNPNGYFGADGLFRLRATGEVERGLAILEIQPGGIKVIDSAPRSFAVGF